MYRKLEVIYLKVIIREEQHLPKTIIQDLCLLLDDDIFIVKWLDQLWLCLEREKIST